MKKLSEKYLKECEQRALSADEHKADYVIKDLRQRIHTLTDHIRKLQSENNSIRLRKNYISQSSND